MPWGRGRERGSPSTRRVQGEAGAAGLRHRGRLGLHPGGGAWAAPWEKLVSACGQEGRGPQASGVFGYGMRPDPAYRLGEGGKGRKRKAEAASPPPLPGLTHIGASTSRAVPWQGRLW